MNVNNRTVKGIDVPVILFVLCIICSFFMLMKDKPDTYECLSLLPVLHGFIILLNHKSLQLSKLTWTKGIILFGYSIRNVITPFLFVLGGCNYVGFHTIRVNSSDDLIKAIFLMGYETAVIFGGMSYIARLYSNKARTSVDKENRLDESLSNGMTLYSIIISFIVILLILGIILVPQIRASYQSMWTTDVTSLISNYQKDEEFYSSGLINRLLYSFYIMFFTVVQIVLSSQIIIWIKHHVSSIRLSILLSTLIPGIFITSFVSNSTIFIIYLCLIIFIFLRVVYIENKSRIDVFVGLSVLIIIVLLIAAKILFANFNSVSGYTMLSSLFNAYFPGAFSISKTWYIEVPNKTMCFLADLRDTFPLQGFLPIKIPGERLNYYFNIAASTDYQLLPFITNTYFYFWLFGPLVQLIFVFYSIKAESKIKYTSNYLMVITYATIIVLFGFGIVTRNITDLMKLFWKTILPCYILAKSSKIHLRIK